MRSRRLGVVALASALFMAVLARVEVRAAEEESFAPADARILAEIRDHSEVMKNLEHLSDNLGARVTGTRELKHANQWTREMFIQYGLQNVHLEPWTIAHSWIRGTARARIVAPVERTLTIASAGWAPGTNGAVTGPVVYVDAKKKEDYEKYRGKLKGAIVLYQEPKPLSPPAPEDPYEELIRPMQTPPPMKGQPAAPPPYQVFREAAQTRTEFFKQEGVALVLRDSNKPHGLLNMTGIGGEEFKIGEIPTAFITGEGYRMLYRMIQHGPVQVEAEIANTFSEKPVEVYNTVAEIRGSEKPDEVVILGAHLDSWDLGTGSTDNGTGSMVVLEAARTLAKLNLKPKRTIRFVLFTGEEEGLVGSEKYVQQHKDELDKISGVLVHDAGTGRVLALGLHDNYQDREIVDRLIAPLRELKMMEPSIFRSFGTDHASFNEVGVPGFWSVQHIAEYSKTHHSQSDTFDKAWKDDLIQGAQVLAAWAYNTAQLPEMLPRRPLPYSPAKEVAAAEAAKIDPIADMDEKLIAQTKKDEDSLKADLTYLTDRIGPRLTGSAKLDQASEWTAEQFRKMGLANVHKEPWTIANSWTRGAATARIVAPVEQSMTLVTAGWSPSTKGTIRGKVIGLTIDKIEDLQKYKGKLKGAIVAMGRPRDLEPPQFPLLTPWGEETIPVARPKSDQPFDFRKYIKTLMAEIAFLSEERAGAVLSSSDKLYGLLNMNTLSREYKASGFPGALVAGEHYRQLWRLLDAGPVEMEVNIQGALSGKPVTVYNTVAEIPGTEKPDEVVILGAHLDSWDLGTGATDNGTGSAAVLAAARALQKSGVKPKRTIRFVLFTGEEQGLNGSREYVKAHKNELEKISGVLVHDSGTGKVLTVGLMANYGVKETMDRALYPLAKDKSIGLAETTLRVEGGTDHVPFDEAGVPAFWCVQDPVDYDRTHHSQADTIERVRWDDLTEGAQVLAVFAYNVAQLPEMLTRKPAKAGKGGM